MLPNEDAINSILKPYIGPWYESLENPQHVQEQVLIDLLQKYGSTDYGQSHKAQAVQSLQDYQKTFPITNYATLTPYLAKIRKATTKCFCLSLLNAGL